MKAKDVISLRYFCIDVAKMICAWVHMASQFERQWKNRVIVIQVIMKDFRNMTDYKILLLVVSEDEGNKKN